MHFVENSSFGIAGEILRLGLSECVEEVPVSQVTSRLSAVLLARVKAQWPRFLRQFWCWNAVVSLRHWTLIVQSQGVALTSCFSVYCCCYY